MAFDLKSQGRNFILLSVILLSLSIYFFRDSISLFPSFIHAWTQSDRYALALGFSNNGFDFFHPQTYNLATIDGITRVDFPIHEYIVALMMKITGIHTPVIFRTYILLYALIGLIFLFRLSQLFTESFFKNAFVVLFLFLCPVFIYYADGFIPSIPSLSNLFIGYFFYFRYKNKKSKSDFSYAIFFLTLAALARLPFFIFMFAVFLQQILIYFKNKRIEWNEVKWFTIAFAIFGAYQLYNSWLGNKYGTQFLTSFLPPSNGGQVLEWMRATWSHWRFAYFTSWHYIIFFLLVVIFLYQVAKKKISFQGYQDLLFQIAIAASGSFIYFFLMLQQFPDHDYYFIDVFYPIVSLLIIYLMRFSFGNKIVSFSLSVILVALLVFSLIEAKETQLKRYETGYWDRVETTRKNFEGASAFLDSIGISKSDKVLVLDGYTTNVPLMMMNRKGWTVNWTTLEHIEEGMAKPYNLVAIQNDFIASDVVKNDPGLIKRLKKIADNGLVSFYRREDIANQTQDQFFGIDSATMIYSKTDIDSIFIDSTLEFTEFIHDSISNFLKNKPIKILITGKILRLSGVPQLIASASNTSGVQYYSGFDLNDYTDQSLQWQNMLFQFVIPSVQDKSGNLKIYFWNNAKAQFRIRDLRTVFYR